MFPPSPVFVVGLLRVARSKHRQVLSSGAVVVVDAARYEQRPLMFVC
jgi:hypothetical protein